MLIVLFETDYADEFTVYGYRVMTEEDYEQFLREMEEDLDAGHTEFYFGTNEFLVFENMKELEACLTVRHIAEADARAFETITWRGTYGFFPGSN